MDILGWEPFEISQDQDFSASALLTLYDQMRCFVALLCIVVCLAASFASNHGCQKNIHPHTNYDNQKCL